MSEKEAVRGHAALVQKLQRVRAASLGVVTGTELQTLLLSRSKARFAQGVAPDGSPWAGLYASTISRKLRKGYRHPTSPLRATDRLFNALNIIRGSNAGLLGTSTGLGFRIGVTDPVAAAYGRIHNYGLAGQEKRQFIGLSTLDVLSVKGYLARRAPKIAQA